MLEEQLGNFYNGSNNGFSTYYGNMFQMQTLQGMREGSSFQASAGTAKRNAVCKTGMTTQAYFIEQPLVYANFQSLQA